MADKRALHRKTVAQILAGVFVLIGLYFGWRRLEVAQEQVGVAREEQITERFTQAVEQLGSEKLEVRLGGISALDRIAKDSHEDRWTIMEVLTAYERENARGQTKKTSGEPPDEAAESPVEKESEDNDRTKPRTDIQAILTVLGRRSKRKTEEEGKHIDLRETAFSGAVLMRVNLLETVLISSEVHFPDWLAFWHVGCRPPLTVRQ